MKRSREVFKIVAFKLHRGLSSNSKFGGERANVDLEQEASFDGRGKLVRHAAT